jgi:hypothetical protein
MSVHALIDSLNALRWEDEESSLSACADLLREFWSCGKPAEAVASYLGDLSYPEPAVSRTAELHSWKLCRNQTWDLTLNQFREFQGERASENIHNHTRVLVSLTISGGYKQDYFRPLKPLCEFKEGELWTGDIERYDGPITYPGFVYVTGVDVFHALTDFIPGTMTLVVYGPLRQDSIVCFNQLTNRVERRCTATCAKDELVNTLRQIAARRK